MASTRTGNFGIGFRRGGGDWQKDLAALCDWAKSNGFECLDLGPDLDAARQVRDAGLAVGSLDLLAWKEMISPDQVVRDRAVEQQRTLIAAAGELGIRSFFCAMLPADPQRPRAENFDFMVDSFKRIMPDLEQADARLVIEGWPGPGALCCTPETLRAFFKAMDSDAAGVNYDPSHLIRMGIEPHMFLHEFVDRVGHVHGKDTEILAERQYDLGTEQPATFARGIAFGGTHWRYTLPGHGQTRWTKVFEMLHDARYAGYVSIELEDANFNGSEAGEKAGLLASRAFLESC